VYSVALVIKNKKSYTRVSFYKNNIYGIRRLCARKRLEYIICRMRRGGSSTSPRTRLPLNTGDCYVNDRVFDVGLNWKPKYECVRSEWIGRRHTVITTWPLLFRRSEIEAERTPRAALIPGHIRRRLCRRQRRPRANRTRVYTRRERESGSRVSAVFTRTRNRSRYAQQSHLTIYALRPAATCQ